MNDQRRKRIESFIETLWQAKEDMEEVKDEEEDELLGLENIAEDGGKMRKCVDLLGEAITSVDEAYSKLQDIVE